MCVDGYGTDYYLSLTARDLVFENLPSAERMKKVPGKASKAATPDPSWIFALSWPKMLS
jgi:hypothetical protein